MGNSLDRDGEKGKDCGKTLVGQRLAAEGVTGGEENRPPLLTAGQSGRERIARKGDSREEKAKPDSPKSTAGKPAVAHGKTERRLGEDLNRRSIERRHAGVSTTSCNFIKSYEIIANTCMHGNEIVNMPDDVFGKLLAAITS